MIAHSAWTGCVWSDRVCVNGRCCRARLSNSSHIRLQIWRFRLPLMMYFCRYAIVSLECVGSGIIMLINDVDVLHNEISYGYLCAAKLPCACTRSVLQVFEMAAHIITLPTLNLSTSCIHGACTHAFFFLGDEEGSENNHWTKYVSIAVKAILSTRFCVS